MRWINKIPSKPGIYLRKNPAASQVVRQDIIEVNGKLYTNLNGSLCLLGKWHGAKIMLWYGPITFPVESQSKK